MPGLGYIKQPDPRNIPVSRLMAPTDANLFTKFHPMFKKELDQGDTGTCVGHAGAHYALTAPIVQSADPFFLYRESCTRDIWPENDGGDLHFGTSILALMKAMQAHGYITSYVWSQSALETARWICNFTPAIIGVNWYDSFFDVETGGVLKITPNARVVGGHAVLLRGWNNKTGMFRLVNSWGPLWAFNGQCWLPAEMLDRLIREEGEIALPSERRLPKAA